jgi:co-chaperonin GroES (HSP10)
MKIVPLRKNILIEEIKNFNAKTSGGIIVPTGEQDRFTLYGRVLGVGYDVRDVKEGNLVYTDKRRCIQTTFGDTVHWIVEEQMLIGKVILDKGEVV